MILYHGSTEPALEILRPKSKSNSGSSLLYLTNNRAYSLFYIRDREIDFVTCGVDGKGIVQYDEKFSDQLKILYRGRSGYIYITDQEAERSKINGIYICRGEAIVTEVEYIPDAYEAILKEIEIGNVNFLSFDNLSEKQKLINHQGVVHLLKNVRITQKKEMFLRHYFPDAWKEAKEK